MLLSIDSYTKKRIVLQRLVSLSIREVTTTDLPENGFFESVSIRLYAIAQYEPIVQLEIRTMVCQQQRRQKCDVRIQLQYPFVFQRLYHTINFANTRGNAGRENMQHNINWRFAEVVRMINICVRYIQKIFWTFKINNVIRILLLRSIICYDVKLGKIQKWSRVVNCCACVYR